MMTLLGLTFQSGLHGKKGAMRQSIRSTISTATTSSSTARRCVRVILLNKEELQVLVEPKAKVTEVFNQVCDHIGLRESEYFGLAQLIEDEYHFVDLDLKVSKLMPKSWRSHHNSGDGQPQVTLYFRVQFYVDHVMLLRERVTRHQYYLQLRDSILHAAQECADERCFLLAAYALQADLGSYNTKKHHNSYFDPREYFPAWVISKHGVDYIMTSMPAMHADLCGLTKMEAQMQYIKDVTAPPAAHNLHFYRLKKRKTDIVGTAWLGICPKGIEIYEDLSTGFKSLLSTFLWPNIGKLYFEKKKFEIRAVGTPEGRKFTYYTGSDERSKYLLSLCRATHLFQMTVQAKLAEIRHLEAEDKRRFRNVHKEAYIHSDNRDLCREKDRSSVRSKHSQNSTPSNGLAIHSAGGNLEQRVSVISSASSNTTSGIVSDKMHSFDDSEDDTQNMEIMIDSPPSKVPSCYTSGSYTTPKARPAPLHCIPGFKGAGVSSSPASLNRLGELPRAHSSSSRGCSSVSRTSSGHSQKSGKLSFTPITTIADLHPYPKHRPGQGLVPAEVQIQRVNLAPTMTVSSTPVPPGVGVVFSGVATSGAHSMPAYRNTPVNGACYVTSSNKVANGYVNSGLRNNPGYEYIPSISPVVGRTYVAESHPVQQTVTAVGVHPVSMYAPSPVANGVIRGVSQPIVMSPHGQTAGVMSQTAGVMSQTAGVMSPHGQTAGGFNAPLQGNNYPVVHPAPQYAVPPVTLAYPYNTTVAIPQPVHPDYSVHVVTSQPMVVSSHPHLPQPIAPQQCLPVEPRPPPSTQASNVTLTPHVAASLEVPNPTMTQPQTIPPQQTVSAPPPQVTQQVASLQAPQQVAPPQPPIMMAVSCPSQTVNVTPSNSRLHPNNIKPSPSDHSGSAVTVGQSLIPPVSVPPSNITELPPQPQVDHSVTVDVHTTGPSTPLTVLPPTTVASLPEYSPKADQERPPTIAVVPPVTTTTTEPSSCVTAAAAFHTTTPPNQTNQASSSSSSPTEPVRSGPAKGQRGGLVPTGDSWGFSNTECNPRAGNRAQPRHHSMGRYDQLLSPNAARDSESRRRGRRSKTCPAHGMMPNVAAELQGLTNKNLSLPLLSALCNDSSLLKQVAEKCNCESRNSSRDDQSVVASPSNTLIPNEPGSIVRPLSWHSDTFNLDRTLKLLNDEEMQGDSGSSPVIPPSGLSNIQSTVRRPHSDELATLSYSQFNSTPLLAGLLAPTMGRGTFAETSSSKYMNHSAMFPSKLTSGGHSPNSSETLHQQANMGLA